MPELAAKPAGSFPGRKRRNRLLPVGSAIVGSLLCGCALLAPLPEPTTVEERLAVFPTTGLLLQGRVVVHWNENQIPFIEADHDGDAAFVLGLVHAHLRLGQMEIYRRVSQGRIAEMGGMLATDIDHGLRILDFGRASAKIEAILPQETRDWLTRFVQGINHYQKKTHKLPHEFGLLGLQREPWTIRDVLTFGRLTGTDVNWLVWFNLLRLRDRADWPALWARLVAHGSDSLTSFGSDGGAGRLNALLGSLSRSGSNSLAVASARSATGAAIMANDPHLGIFLPNTWLLAGIKSPSYHAVGLMVPGLPFFAIGRNPWMAWGGTNMRAASSDLYEVGTAEITTRRERIGVRWWFDREIEIRETKWGPVLSDAPQLAGKVSRPFALRWTGHEASDEITAMLRVSRARNFADFRDAFSTFAVPGQNMLYADNDGNIGQVMAVSLPDRRGPLPKDIVLESGQREAAWNRMLGADELPFSFNPEQGFLVSANNRPVQTDIHVGYFFSPDDRVERMTELLGGGPVGIDDIKALQQDVYMPSSVALRDALLDRLDRSGLAVGADSARAKAVAAMRGWDGLYRRGSQGAVAFEAFRDAFARAFYEAAMGEEDWAAFANIAGIRQLMIADMERTGEGDLDPALELALSAAARAVEEFPEWGAMHRLGLAHPLSFVPLIGDRYRFADMAVGGSSDTLMKTAHGATGERHFTRYGSNARHISDMSDPDRNYFVLLGGQDGHFNSASFLDQAQLWLSGAYIEMPLRIETVRERFAHRIELGA